MNAASQVGIKMKFKLGRLREEKFFNSAQSFVINQYERPCALY